MTASPPSSPPPPPAAARRAGFLRVMGTVFWSFLGIRRKAAFERDAGTIKPIHVVAAGILGAAVLVAILVIVVSVVTQGH